MQKGESQNRCFKKTEYVKFSEKAIISNPLIPTYQGVRNVCFSENLACFVFLKHSFSYSPFCFITGGFQTELVTELNENNVGASQFDLFQTIFLGLLNKLAPSKKKTLKNNQSSFLTKNASKVIMTR